MAGNLSNDGSQFSSLELMDKELKDKTGAVVRCLRIAHIRTGDPNIMAVLSSLGECLKYVGYLQVSEKIYPAGFKWSIGVFYRPGDVAPFMAVMPFKEIQKAYAESSYNFNELTMETRNALILSIGSYYNPFVFKFFRRAADAAGKFDFVNRENIGVISVLEDYGSERKLTIVVATNQAPG